MGMSSETCSARRLRNRAQALVGALNYVLFRAAEQGVIPR